MKLVTLATTILAFSLPAFAYPKTETGPLTWAYAYGDPATPLTAVACSNGPNGLIAKGYNYLGDLKAFPYLGGMYPVVWNSPLCGTCWKLTYKSSSVYMLAVDYAATGFVASEKVMNDLTGGKASQLGTVQGVTAEEVDVSYCKM